MSDSKAALTKSPDIQGLIFHAYKEVRFAGYRPFEITDRRRFQAWLHGLLQEQGITAASRGGGPDTRALNIAFTKSGLECLLGQGWIEESYEASFLEGMITEHRSRVLGDVGDSAPSRWDWGRERIDGLLLAFDTDREALETRLALAPERQGARPTARLPVGDRTPLDRQGACLEGKEPFGFADGLSQPIVSGTSRHRDSGADAVRLHVVPPGELVLGYPDGSGALPRSPAVTAGTDRQGRLQPHWEWPDRRDLGRNGSYMVLRQLAQDVDGFWDHLRRLAAPSESAEDLGARMIGRKLDGSPLAGTAGAGPDDNGFDFRDDPGGYRCPYGAHIRRTNPRASGETARKKAKDKVAIVNRHRILRRGRPYAGPDGVAEGLMFLCFNASIRRQFEFVQATWCNNRFFQGMDGEVDPLIGTLRAAERGLGALDGFTLQQAPYRRRLSGLRQFVTVKGGVYLFLPSLSALACLSDAP